MDLKRALSGRDREGILMNGKNKLLKAEIKVRYENLQQNKTKFKKQKGN
jgi:hypothetical protein